MINPRRQQIKEPANGANPRTRRPVRDPEEDLYRTGTTINVRTVAKPRPNMIVTAIAIKKASVRRRNNGIGRG
jgi:hypothetical protein